MPNHFTTIGFSVESEDGLLELANELAETAESISVAGGTYLHWSDRSGAEMWIQVNRENELIGIAPHFAGPGRVRLRLVERIRREEDSTLDGAFLGWVQSPEDQSQGDGYPLAFDSPQFRKLDPLRLPAIAPVQIAAFAHELSVYPTVEAFDASQAEEVRFASQSFIPSGLFTPDGKRTDPAQSYAIFAGHVKASELKQNSFTDRPFYWALVESLDATFDVVIDPEMTDDVPPVGGVMVGSYYLSGLLSPPVDE